MVSVGKCDGRSGIYYPRVRNLSADVDHAIHVESTLLAQAQLTRLTTKISVATTVSCFGKGSSCVVYLRIRFHMTDVDDLFVNS